MDIRTLTLTFALLATACAGAVYPPTLEEPAPTATPPPVTPEALAESALERIASDCEDRRGCATYLERDIYPEVAVSSVERNFVTSLHQEVRSVGILLRFEPGGRTLELERGNTLTYRALDDPPS